MTTDKIKFYIGEQIFNHIVGLNKSELETMKLNCINEIEYLNNNTIVDKHKFLFERNIELNFINYRLS